jgi:hypothetical protein
MEWERTLNYVEWDRDYGDCGINARYSTGENRYWVGYLQYLAEMYEIQYSSRNFSNTGML